MALRLVPAGGLIVISVVLTWLERGSIAAYDWVPYLVLAAAILGVVALAGVATSLRPLQALGASALAAFAVWAAVSAVWSPSPSLARDEALLRAFYAIALVVTATTVRSAIDRAVVAALVVGAAGAVAVATALHVLFTDESAVLFQFGRLAFPITYPNAAAAFFAVAFWPAVAIAASRTLAVPLRAAAVAAATGCGCAVIAYQSKGALAALALSAVVFFALSPLRLRALVPTGIAVAASAAAFVPLTETIRVDDAAVAAAGDDGARALLGVTVAAAAAAALYAMVDRRLTLAPRVVRVAGIAVWAAMALAVVAGVFAFMRQVEDPSEYLSQRWDELQTTARDDSFTHFATLGSNRFDFWRVAVDDFEDSPVGGRGSRGFAASYLADGESTETPARAHSLPFDVLGEEGLVGGALLLLALAPLVGIALVRGRDSLGAAALAGAATYWLAHAAVDWNWSFPAVGIPFFVLLGAAVGGPGPRLPAAGRGWLVAAAAVVAVAAAAPWVSGRLADRALAQPDRAADDLRLARRLDPLSTRPLVVEWQLAQTPDARIDALRRALQREPESFALRYFLGLALRDAGRTDEARQTLLEAKRRAPRVEAVDDALSSLGG